MVYGAAKENCGLLFINQFNKVEFYYFLNEDTAN